jgi:hypothetical protein
MDGDRTAQGVGEADHYAFRLPKAGLVDIPYFAHIA